MELIYVTQSLLLAFDFTSGTGKKIGKGSPLYLSFLSYPCQLFCSDTLVLVEF